MDANLKKRKIAEIKGSICSVCGVALPHQQFEIHHLNPVTESDTEDIGNLQLLCPNCHRSMHTSQNNRLAGAAIGGAVLGASLGGPVGAIVGGVIGLLMGDSANKNKKEDLNG